MKKDNHYLGWGITAVAVVCSILLFYDIVFRDSMLLSYASSLITILKPIIYGAFTAYLLAPMVNWFEKIIVPRVKRVGKQKKWLRAISITLTWLIVLILLSALLLVLLPQLYKSILQLIDNGESYYNNIVAWAQNILDKNPQFAATAGQLMEEYYNDLITWISGQLLPKMEVAIQAVTGGVVGVIIFLKDTLVGFIVSIYLLAAKERFAATGKKLCYAFLNEKHADLVLRGTRETDRIFSGFVRGKLLDSLIIGILCFIFSTIFRFPYAPLVSLIVGVTNVIPYFGPFMGAIPSAFLILLDDPLKCLYFCIFILALQQFDGNILGPSILGETLGLSSFWVIVAILLGGGLFGVPGMFLGAPVFACLYTAVRAISASRLKKKGLPPDTEAYYSDKPSPTGGKDDE